MKYKIRTLYWRLRHIVCVAFDVLSDLALQIKSVAVFFAPVLLVGSTSQTAKFHFSGDRKNLLILSYYSYPYLSRHGTQRLGKFIKYLSRMGWNITLITTRPDSTQDVEPSSDDYPVNVEVIRVAVAKPKILYWRGVLVPDSYIFWMIPAIKAGLKVIKERNISVIFSTAPPYSNLMAGAVCSRVANLPFVSDFRDPWSRIDTGWNLENSFLRKLTSIIEKRVLNSSSLIVMADPLEYTEQFFGRVAPNVKQRIVSILNGYDEEDFADIESMRVIGGNKFVISYVGTFYDFETFTNVLKPLLLWQARHADDFANVVFEYAGGHSSFFGDRDKLPFVVMDHGYLSHRDAISLRAKSQVQIFSQPRHFKSHVMSGKIYEMIRSGVPILAITSADSGPALLISETQSGRSFSQDNSQDSADYLKELYDLWLAGCESQVSITNARVTNLSRERQAATLAELLQSM